MPNNDERREVAARLREHQHGDVRSPTYEGGMISSWLRLKDALDANGCDPQEDHTMMFGYLADLIEPEPERTSRYFVSDLFPEEGVRCLACKEWVAADNYCGNCGARLVRE